MKVILREDRSAVSEVVGTILILGMTVVLFSTIIIWVSSFPGPQSQLHVDVTSSLTPIYNALGQEVGVNITLIHGGGEALLPISTMIYVTDQPAGKPPTTDRLTLHLFNGALASPNGLLDGTDSVWDIGERWAYKNFVDRSADSITVTVVDNSKGVVVWSAPLNPPPGVRPPVFVSVWTDGVPATLAPDPIQATLGFALYAKVMDPDGDLNVNSVYATITAWYGSGTACAFPLKMHDDGAAPDRVAGDGIFSLGNNVCMNSPYPPLNWAGTYILLNATDLRGHQTVYRLQINVVPQSSGGNFFNGTTIPNQIWQYIGYVQIRTGEVWVSNLSDPYNTASRYQPFRVTASMLNSNGGALFHFKMANHGNTTIFIDGWTEAFLSNTQSSSGFAMFIVAPCSTTIAANAGGVAAYPGNPSNINDFEYAHTGLPAGCSVSSPAGVFDINPLNQEVGGNPYVVMVYNRNPFGVGQTKTWQSATYFMSILVSGMAGPANYTYSMLQGIGSNPANCAGLGPNYNPHDHLTDPIAACRTTWYAQVIPFIGLVAY